MNMYFVSLDGAIEDGIFKAPTSEKAVELACKKRGGWTYSQDVYDNASWELLPDDCCRCRYIGMKKPLATATGVCLCECH